MISKATPIDNYVETARSTAIYPEAARFYYPVLGLAGEFGETIDELFPEAHIKGIKIPVNTIISELGDVLWYVTNTALDLGFQFRDLTDVITGGLRCETFEDICFQMLRKRDQRSPFLKMSIHIGQLAEVAKKGLRDGYGTELSTAKRAICVNALAQLLVGLCELCEKYGFTLDEVAFQNNKKLTDRQKRDKLGGDGNER